METDQHAADPCVALDPVGPRLTIALEAGPRPAELALGSIGEVELHAALRDVPEPLVASGYVEICEKEGDPTRAVAEPVVDGAVLRSGPVEGLILGLCRAH